MMKATEFAARCRNVALQIPTVYLKGAFGAPLSADYLARMRKLYPTWYHDARMERLKPYLDKGIFGFDCVCFLKGILWGWDADITAPYGGAAYKANGVPDLTVEGMRQSCEGLSEDFSQIQCGEAVFLPGHVGVYLGNGLCAESTPAFGGGALGMGGVILSACNRKIEGYPTRMWKEHGRLPFVDYSEEAGMPEREETAPADGGSSSASPEQVPSANEPPENAPQGSEAKLPSLARGAKGEAVRALQALLNLRMGASPAWEPLALDGSFGPATKKAVAAWQKRRGREETAMIGAEDWLGLIED